MNQLFSPQEIQAILALLNRAPMTPAEQLFAQGFFQRLVAFCQPPELEPIPLSPDEALRETVTCPHDDNKVAQELKAKDAQGTG